jgi:shikimate kinase
MRLIEERHPVYAEADITVDTVDGPPEATLAKVLDALDRFCAPAQLGVSP